MTDKQQEFRYAPLGPYDDGDGYWCCATINGGTICSLPGEPCPYGLFPKPRTHARVEPDSLPTNVPEGG